MAPGRRAPTTTPAIRLANVAGGLEVEKIGVATVTRDEILHDIRTQPLAASRSLNPQNKLVDRQALGIELENQRRAGKRIASESPARETTSVPASSGEQVETQRLPPGRRRPLRTPATSPAGRVDEHRINDRRIGADRVAPARSTPANWSRRWRPTSSRVATTGPPAHSPRSRS